MYERPAECLSTCTTTLREAFRIEHQLFDDKRQRQKTADFQVDG